MKYLVRINKRVRYLRAYSIRERVGEHQNVLTRMLTRLLNRKPAREGPPA